MPSPGAWASLLGFALMALAAQTVIASEMPSSSLIVCLSLADTGAAAFNRSWPAGPPCGTPLHAVNPGPEKQANTTFSACCASAGRQQAKLTQQEGAGVPLAAGAELAAAIVLLLYGEAAC